MREILFRGKREDNGEWIEGSLLFDPDLGSTQIIGFEYWTSETGIERGEFSEFVNRETVGQYTGLTDKNDKRIFEGDICRVCLDPEICISRIQYDQRIASFLMRHNDNECSTFLDMWFAKQRVGDRVWIEVIGNIHDNPELMEGS